MWMFVNIDFGIKKEITKCSGDEPALTGGGASDGIFAEYRCDK